VNESLLHMTMTRVRASKLLMRFPVSLGMVKKLLPAAPTHGRASRHGIGSGGRKPMIVSAHQSKMRALLASKKRPDTKGIAGSNRTEMFLAGDQCRVGEDGVDI